MGITEALEYVYSIKTSLGPKRLEPMRALLSALGNPDKEYRILHVAGTNGKGSVCAFAARILMSAGLKVGLFTSPYLIRFNERIRVNDAEIADGELAALISNVKAALRVQPGWVRDGMTQFGFITAAALYYYAQKGIDVAVIETGLGGRLDPTNVLMPSAVAVTAIGYDHMHILGNTIEEIAADKAGIIKPGIPAVIYPQPYIRAHRVLTDCAYKANASVADLAKSQIIIKSTAPAQIFDYKSDRLGYEGLEIRMHGQYQVANACTALELAHAVPGLELDEKHVREGLKNTLWQGRFEVIKDNPAVILDGAHNPDGMKALISAYKQLYPRRRAVLLMGFTHGHDHGRIVAEAAGIADTAILTRPEGSRAVDPSDIEGFFPSGVKTIVIPGVRNAYNHALEYIVKHGKGSVLLVTGSLYLVGEIKRLIRDGLT